MKYDTRLVSSNDIARILNEMTAYGWKFVQAVNTGGANFPVTLIFSAKDK